MGVSVCFDYNRFAARYPEFANVDSQTINEMWCEATLYHANNGEGPIEDCLQQTMLLNMVTAHIAELNRVVNGQAVTVSPGRISSASQGSVSLSSELAVAPGSGQWYAQTKYGFAYWNATMQYRAANYRVAPQRIFEPVYAGRPLIDQSGPF